MTSMSGLKIFFYEENVRERVSFYPHQSVDEWQWMHSQQKACLHVDPFQTSIGIRIYDLLLKHF